MLKCSSRSLLSPTTSTEPRYLSEVHIRASSLPGSSPILYPQGPPTPKISELICYTPWVALTLQPQELPPTGQIDLFPHGPFLLLWAWSPPSLQAGL